MKEILEKLKTLIPQEIPEIKAVYVLPDLDLLPAVVQYPCVGLKDGESIFSEGAGQTEQEKSSILVGVYVQILKEEASIMGDGGKKGVLELMDDLRSALNFNELDGLVDSFYGPEIMASEIMIAGENVFVQRKGCRFYYEIT